MKKWLIGSMALAVMATMAQPRAHARTQQDQYPDMQPMQPYDEQQGQLQQEPVQPPDFGALAVFTGHLTCSGTALSPDLSQQKNLTLDWNGRTDLGGQILSIRGQEQQSDISQGGIVPMQFLAIVAYDPSRQRFVAYAFDSFGNHEQDVSNVNNMNMNNVSGVRGGNTISFNGRMMTGNGQATPVRETFIRTGRNGFHWIGEATVNGRQQRLMDLTCQR